LEAALDGVGLSEDVMPIYADNAPGARSIADLFRETGRLSGAIIAIGSERGWSERERALFQERGWTALSLGSRALRTETACVAAAALCLAMLCSPCKGA
jgi:RsmE family RNA methyltransferase